MANGDLDPLYKDRPVTLWVEDPLTRDYLREAWDDPQQVRLLVAGNNQAVRTLVGSARQSGYANVFGLCDRDFGASNRASWSGTTTVFELEMHEIENAMLHPEALAAATNQLGTRIAHTDIAQRLSTEANTFVWGMALGSTLSWLRETTRQDFPHADGLVNISDQKAAEARILGSPWWPGFATMPTRITEASVRQELASRHGAFTGHLRANKHLTEFAGKELLGRVFAWLTKGKATREDLTKQVGTIQRTNSWLPSEITHLQSILVAAAT